MKFSIIRTDKQQVQRLTAKTAEELIERMRTDTKAGAIARLRDHVASTGSTQYYEHDDQIGRVYPSVCLAKTDNGRLEMTAFNGIVWLHVAQLMRQADLEAVKEASKMLPTTYAAFEGADGRSVEILVAAAPKGAPIATEADADLFCQQAYRIASGIYNGMLPMPVERMAVNARSHFRMPLDGQPYFNPDATPLLVDATATTGQDSLAANFAAASPADADTIVPHPFDGTDMQLYGDYELLYARAAEEAADDTRDMIAPHRQEAYITELAHRLCQAGLPEEEAFLHISNHHHYSPSYDEFTFRAIVEAVYAEEQPGRPSTDLTVSRETRRLVDFLTRRYVFRYNTVMGYTEYRPNNTWVVDWKPCDQNAINGITLQARLANLDVHEHDVRRYVLSDVIRPCDPLSDYMMKAAKAWDGTTDHIALLARCVPCDLPQWEEWFRKWFVAMVAQWVLPRQEYGNAVVPLLISPQGDGKTTFCRMLLPPELQWGFLENLDVGEKRQTLQAMHNFLLINLDEFNQISPRLQEGFLKNVIQLPSVKMKRPYGKHVEEFKRNASFIATTNDLNVLSDPTGSRRFICVQLTAPVRTDYKPNYEALYGQAWTLIMERRMKWYFDADEVKAIQQHNSAYQLVPPAVHYFHTYFDVADSEADGSWLSATAIYTRLRQLAGSGLNVAGISRFGRVLGSIEGLRRKRTTAGALYLVKEKTD